MSKFLVETHYTCTFKIVHELDELNEKSLSEVDNRKDGKVEIVNVTVNNRKTKRSDGKKGIKSDLKLININFDIFTRTLFLTFAFLWVTYLGSKIGEDYLALISP